LVYHFVCLAVSLVTMGYYVVFTYFSCKGTPQHEYYPSPQTLHFPLNSLISRMTAAESANPGLYVAPAKSPSDGYTCVSVTLIFVVAVFWLVWSILGLVWGAQAEDCVRQYV